MYFAHCLLSAKCQIQTKKQTEVSCKCS